MCKPASLAAVVLLALATAPAALAQGGPEFSCVDASWSNSTSSAHPGGGRHKQIVRSVPSSLRMRAMVAHRAGACGYGLTLQQFAYNYAAANGCTPEDYALQ